MTKLPWMKWFFDDLDDDCGSLSLAARGGWVWILGNLHHHGGERSLTLDGWARVVRASHSQTATVLAEIINSRTCDSNLTPSVTRDGLLQKNDALVTVTSRRIKREHKARETHSLRQKRYREKNERDAANDACVTDKKQKQKQNIDSPLPSHNGNGDLSVHSLWLILWESYPAHRRGEQSPIPAEFLALKPTRALVDHMALALDQQKASESWTEKEGKYVPGLKKWLSGRGWEVVKVQAQCITCNRTGVIVRDGNNVLSWTLERECEGGMQPEVCPVCKGKNRVNVAGLPNVKFPCEA